MGVVGVNAGLNAEELSPGSDEKVSTRKVLWFDAHADLETPDTTESGYLDGMGGSMLLGEDFGYSLSTMPGYRPIEGRRLVAVGFRSRSEFEEEKIVSQGARLVRGGKPVDGDPLRRFMKDLDIMLVEGEEWEAVLHMDVDVLDTSIGRANDFAVEGGLGAKELLECMDLIGNRRRVKAMHVASLNPECEGWETSYRWP